MGGGGGEVEIDAAITRGNAHHGGGGPLCLPYIYMYRYVTTELLTFDR